MVYIQPVILCGGSGSRLWPLSRTEMPKQFLNIFNNKSLLELTLERIKEIPNSRSPIIITSVLYQYFVKNLLERLNLNYQIILEPEAKNTTAAIYISICLTVSEEDCLLILPSDHMIPDISFFLETVNFTRNNFIDDSWFLFGVRPSNPSTSYGYIRTNNSSNKIRKVIKFEEKPDLKNAINMVQSKNYFWNAGIFMGQVKMVLKSIDTYANDIAKACDNVLSKSVFNKFDKIINLDNDSFKEVRSQSIDYAVFEYENNLNCIIFDAFWSDVGSWDTFLDIPNQDYNSKNAYQIDGVNNIFTTNNRTIVTVGVDNLIIIDSEDATLITKKNNSEKLKSLLDVIKISNPDLVRVNNYEERPWGRFDVLLSSDALKVKKLNIYPNKRLSLQFHKRRSEHWFIVQGNAKIHLNGREFILKAGNSIDIAKEAHHFIANETEEELIVIEVQQGDYLKEDDIVRLDDLYGREIKND
jgi:mannose-1-phosphate guanylyltransferase